MSALATLRNPHFIFYKPCVQMCLCAWVSEQMRSWHTHTHVFMNCMWHIYPLPARNRCHANNYMRWKERDKRIKPQRNDSEVSSAWLGIHNQTSQIRGNREDINAASKDKWEKRGMRCEGRGKKLDSDCNKLFSIYYDVYIHAPECITWHSISQPVQMDLTFYFSLNPFCRLLLRNTPPHM